MALENQIDQHNTSPEHKAEARVREIEVRCTTSRHPIILSFICLIVLYADTLSKVVLKRLFHELSTNYHKFSPLEIYALLFVRK